MSEAEDPKSALHRLDAALSKLETAAASNQEAIRDQNDLEDEIQRLNDDRAKLADQLDTEKAKNQQLAETNADVSRRLVAAMENIRGILERH